MKSIRDIPLGDIYGNLLGNSPPDPLKKSRQAGVKLHCLGGKIIV